MHRKVSRSFGCDSLIANQHLCSARASVQRRRATRGYQCKQYPDIGRRKGHADRLGSVRKVETWCRPGNEDSLENGTLSTN